jgi:hypothetical protein
MVPTINIEYVTTAMLKINWQTRMRQRFIESEITEYNLEAKHFLFVLVTVVKCIVFEAIFKHWILTRK